MMQVFLCLALLTGAVFAAEEPPALLPPVPLQASWVFSGMVSNENGETYGYFFQMKRDHDQFHATVALLDAERKQVALLEESDAIITAPIPYNWHVGRAFLRFNPINDSWIFGLKTMDKKGFNFKVDLLKQDLPTPHAQALRLGVELLMNQTHHLNGHLQLGRGSEEQFVTSKNAWFRQVWLSAPQDKSHAFSGILCRFMNGSGFYSVKMAEPDALRGAVAGWSDQQGVATVMSQFIRVKHDQQDGPWHIRIASPNLHLVMSPVVKQPTIAAGFVAEGRMPGFCMLSDEWIG